MMLAHPPVLEDCPAPASGPLGHLTEAEIRHLLRGFSERALSGALALRTGRRVADYESCLFGILIFYRPPGSETLGGDPSGESRLHEDFGLDSLSMSEAMFKIEDLFEVTMDNAELTEIATIADARRLLIRKLPSPPPTGTNE